MYNYIRFNKFKNNNFILLVLWLALLLPFLYSILFVVPSADDFSISIGVTGHSFIPSINRANHVYMTWSGGWTAFFIRNMINPMLPTLSYQLLVLEMIVNFFFFVIAWSYFLSVIFKYYFYLENQSLRRALVFVIIAAFLCGNNYREVFYWWDASSYNWYSCFFAISTSCAICYFNNSREKTRSIWLVMIFFGLLACNVMMFIVPTIVIYALLLWRSSSIKEEKRMKILKKDVAPLVLYFFLSAITIMAPGNRVRHKAIDESGLHLLRSAFFLVESIALEIVNLFHQPSILIGFIIVFFVGVRARSISSNRIIRPCFWLMAACICIGGSVYPVCLGYSASTMANRTQFLFDIQFVTWLSLFFLSIGVKMKNVHFSKFVMKYVTCGMVVALGIYTWLYCNHSAYYRLITSMDIIQKESMEYKSIYNEICNSEKKEVVICLTPFTVSGVLKGPDLTEDPNHWINRDVASYYNKESVKVIWGTGAE